MHILGFFILGILYLAISFLATPLGIAALIALILFFMVKAVFWPDTSAETWKTFNPPLARGAAYVLAKGRVKEGQFVLMREGVPGRSGVYPFILTLTYFDNAGEMTSCSARLIRNMDENGQVCVGHHNENAVYIDVDTTCGSELVFFGGVNGYNAWQVYPPLPDQQIRVLL